MTRRGRRGCALAILGAGAAVIALTIRETVSAEEAVTIVVLAAFLIAAAALVDEPQRGRFLLRIERLKAFGVEADLRADMTEAARDLKSDGGESGSDVDDDDNEALTTIEELRLSLDRKLAWVVKVLLPANEAHTGRQVVPFATIGSLEEDGYLPVSLATIALQIQSLSSVELASLTPDARDEFIRVAGEVVRGFRFRVFWGILITVVRRHRPESRFVDEVNQRGLLVPLKGAGSEVVLWPSLGLTPQSVYPQSAAKRAAAIAGGRQVIVVVPNNSRFGALTDLDADPAIVKLGDVAALLDRERSSATAAAGEGAS